jgi:penicillin-binding protein 2
VPVYNESRKNIIKLIFISLFVIIILRLITLQILTNKYKNLADDQGIFRRVVYPDRGLIFDRKKNNILQNSSISDLMVTPNKIKDIDTFLLCQILNIDTNQFKKRVVDLIIKNGRSRPSVFEPLLSEEKMALLNESMFKFSPAFYLQERSIRVYPYSAAANVFGYTAEVDTNFLKKHPDEGYVAGDFAGMTGLERSYEKVLMGVRGIQYWKRDNKNRLTERLERGIYDTSAIAGQNLYSSLDIELQELGEKLMQNKLGSIVAIDPKTGGILAMVSAPTYEPKYLTGSERRKHFSELFLNPALPLLNRTVSASYSPGSTFKTLQALIGLHEGVINTSTTFSCSGAFYGCGSGKPMRCLDNGVFDLQRAITVSDNTYFANVMQRVINNPKYTSVDNALLNWDKYMYAFGLGHKLGVDVPSEKSGNIPSPKYYDKVYGKDKWNFCTFRSVSIGQGEVDVTPLQVANEMAYIANKGWYITPHVIDSIEGGDKFQLLSKYKNKINPIDIPDTIFEVVHDGMQGVVDHGTGVGAKVKDIEICGKTGTVENYFRGVKQQNHSFFCGFAPRNNPKIAIMCVVENSGRFGGTYAAPIVGLMIEKYLKDSITDKARLDKIEQLSKLNLIPPRIKAAINKQDSIKKSKEQGLSTKGLIKLIKDTVGIEDDQPDKEDLIYEMNRKNKKNQPENDTSMHNKALKPKNNVQVDKKKGLINLHQ